MRIVLISLLFLAGCSAPRNFSAFVEPSIVTFKDGSSVGFVLELDNRDMVAGEVELAQQLAGKKWYKRGSYFGFLSDFSATYHQKWNRTSYSNDAILQKVIFRIESVQMDGEGQFEMDGPEYVVEMP